MTGPNRKARREMQRQLRRSTGDPTAKVREGEIAIPIYDHRLRAAMQRVYDRLQEDQPKTAADIARLEPGPPERLAHDLRSTVDALLHDLEIRLGERPTTAQALTHVLAWGLALGDERRSGEAAVRALSARRRRADS